MNKTIKIALCISLVGLGMFVWTHFAAAKGKPQPPATTLMTFISGDVVAAPQLLTLGLNTDQIMSASGPFTADVDFRKFEPYISDSSPDKVAVLEFLQSKNPITANLIVDASKLPTTIRGTTNPPWFKLVFSATIDGVQYWWQLGFPSITIDIGATADTYSGSEGVLLVAYGKNLGQMTNIFCRGTPPKMPKPP
jgi:hypothetical protein